MYRVARAYVCVRACACMRVRVRVCARAFVQVCVRVLRRIPELFSNKGYAVEWRVFVCVRLCSGV